MVGRARFSDTNCLKGEVGWYRLLAWEGLVVCIVGRGSFGAKNCLQGEARFLCCSTPSLELFLTLVNICDLHIILIKSHNGFAISQLILQIWSTLLFHNSNCAKLLSPDGLDSSWMLQRNCSKSYLGFLLIGINLLLLKVVIGTPALQWNQ